MTILMLKKCPTKNEGRAMSEFYAALGRHTDISRADIRVEHLLDYETKDKLKAADWPVLLDRMFTLLADYDGATLIACGAVVTQAVLGPCNMAAVHGIPHQTEIAGRVYRVIPIYDPAAGLGNKGFLAALAFDLRALQSFCADGKGLWQPDWCPVNPKWLTKPLGGPADRPGAIVGLDVEGWPDKPWGVQFAMGDNGIGWAIKASQPKLLAWLDSWLANKRVFLHNGIGDLPTLKALGINLRAWEDTQLLAYHHMIRTGSGVLEAESQGLATQAYRLAGTIKGNLASVPGVDLNKRVLPYNDAMLTYAATDAVAEYRLAVALWDWANSTEGILPVYRIDQGQAFLIREMMDHGMPFDYNATTEYYLEALGKEAVVRAELEHMAIKRGTSDFNPGSHVQVRKLITEKFSLRIRQRTKGGAASTNEKALALHAAHPFVAKLQEHRELTKLIGTYLEPLMETLGGDNA